MKQLFNRMRASRPPARLLTIAGLIGVLITGGVIASPAVASMFPTPTPTKLANTAVSDPLSVDTAAKKMSETISECMRTGKWEYDCMVSAGYTAHPQFKDGYFGSLAPANITAQPVKIYGEKTRVLPPFTYCVIAKNRVAETRHIYCDGEVLLPPENATVIVVDENGNPIL